MARSLVDAIHYRELGAGIHYLGSMKIDFLLFFYWVDLGGYQTIYGDEST